MTKLATLRDAQTLDDIARLLGFMPKGLSYVLYKIPDANKYASFEIPKRGTGTRLIKAPQPQLALLQRRLANLLYDCLDELTMGTPPARRSLAHGFERKRSIITNANVHKCRRYVLNLDLEDFFPSINFGRVRGFFMKDKNFALTPKAATVIAQIACHEDGLPQGSPCSPVISNLIGHLLDSRLARFAKKHKCTYSRYADDITFSTNQKHFPSELAAPVESAEGQWALGAELRTKIEHSGFRINDKKTRMQFRGSRQVTTGLMVNEKVNIRQEYWRSTRQMCQSLFSTGSYYRKPTAALAGKEGDLKTEQIMSLHPLGGMLAHIHQVKEYGDRREEETRKDDPTAARRLYRRFLFYKNFVALDRALVVPEGKTDVTYLRCAIRRLAASFPVLGGTVEGKFQTKIRFMNFSPTTHKILEIGRGAAQLNSLIGRYTKCVSEFKHAPLASPVIILVDNDDGGKKLFGLAKKKSGKDITYDSTDPFYHLGLNLYLVKTPESQKPPHMSYIEQLFDPAVLATVLDGKTFDPNKEHEEPGKYGKAAFAARVVEPNADKIDFTGFTPLLNRIVAVLAHHSGLRAASVAAAV